jgi:hypothetical protein
MLLFLLVVLGAGLLGGFVGAEWSDYDRTFSPTGAAVGSLGIAVALLALGALFDHQERKKRNQKLPDNVRRVFERWASTPSGSVVSSPSAVNAAVAASLKKRMDAVDPQKVKIFVYVLSRLGVMQDPIRNAEHGRRELIVQPDPILAALRLQLQLLNGLLDRSRGDPTVMGTNMAKSCGGLCELVVEEVVPEPVGREYFNSYNRVFERVHGIKMPFTGGLFDYDTSLELARESLSKKGQAGDV